LNSTEVERRARAGAWGANHEAERGRFNLEVRQFLQAAVCDFAAKVQSRLRTQPEHQRRSLPPFVSFNNQGIIYEFLTTIAKL
jgi:hypothetical protein